MNKIMFAAVIAVLGSTPAAAQDHGYPHNRNIYEAPRAPQAPRASHAPRENESIQGFTPYQPAQPYQGFKPLRHYNSYTHQWE